MPKQHKAPLALALAAAISLPVSSQAEDLLDIYDIARDADPSLRVAEQNFYAEREIKPQAQALLLPDFSIGGSGSGGAVVSYSDRDNITSDDRSSYTSYGAAANLSQAVFNRASWMTLAQADHRVAQAEATYREAEIELITRVAEAYFEVLRSADFVRVNEALVKANERQLEQSRQRFEVGLVAITDVNDSLAAYDRSRADLIAARNGLDNDWEALRRIIGPVSVPLARLGKDLPLNPPEPSDIQVWAESALQQNFGVIAAKEAVEAARKGIEIQRSGYFPTVGLNASYGLNRYDQVDSSRPETNSGSVGLTLNVPLYQGGEVASKTRQAGYQFQAAQDQLDLQRRAVTNLVKDAFRGVISSISDVEARQAAIRSARSSLESTQAGLEVGTRTQVDVLNAQRELFQAEFDYASARYDYILNGIRLHQANSTLNREVLAKSNAWLDETDLLQPPSF